MDIQTKKMLCVLVRYQQADHKIVTRLFELIYIDATNGSAQVLYNVFKETMLKNNLNLSDIVGLASDGVAVMTGKNNSFFSLLNKDVPHSLLLKCVCHSSALVASKACSVLPNELEELMRGIYTYISSSSKRCAQVIEIQNYFNIEHYKVLKLSGTR
ncbi:hypothetical protein RN001_005062 [Aquatica leii]|uniref:DUF4371 domain-containing protein n=1 Tax=Aquatica leii TaxID=1421715 RepID=A0AAN7SPR3_9COLE|nr:hypothetical protein RN001_005062 [Aquatica leii]